MCILGNIINACIVHCQQTAAATLPYYNTSKPPTTNGKDMFSSTTIGLFNVSKHSTLVKTSPMFGGEGGSPFTDEYAYQTGGALTGFTVWMGTSTYGQVALLS